MRNPVWVLAAVLVASGVASTKLWRDLRAERELAASLQAQLDEVARAPAAMRPASSAPAVVSTPAPAVAVTPSTTAATPANQLAVAAAKTAAPTSAPDILREMENQQRVLMKDPEYRKARLAQLRTTIAGNNQRLAEELGISQAEADKVLDLMAEHDLNMNLDMMLASTANDQAAIQQLARKQEDYVRKRDESIAALLGPARAAEWKQYQQAAPARSRVSSLNSMLVRGGQPMTAAQQKSLAAALAPELQSLNEEMAALSRGIDPQDPAAVARLQEVMRSRQEEVNQRVLSVAAPVLSSGQLALVKAQVEQQDALTRAMLRARERAAATQAQGAP